MTVTCHVCGHAVEIATWTKEHERLKYADDPAFVCDACQEKIRREAQGDQT